MQAYKIIFYDKPNGTEPAREFIDSLDAKMFAKIARAMIILETLGPQIREPHSKPLDEGIFELRAQVGNNITRVLYFFFTGKHIVFTNGFIKKSQETPITEIERAKRYRDEFLNRKENRK